MSNNPQGAASPPLQPGATPVSPAPATPAPPAYPGSQPPPHLADAHSKKILCGLMGIFLGNFGIHKFLLGYTGAGVITLLLNCTGIGLLVLRVITVIEGIIYLTKTDEEFYNLYIANRREWF